VISATVFRGSLSDVLYVQNVLRGHVFALCAAMFRRTLVVCACLATVAVVGQAQQTPIAAMFGDDQKRDQNLAPSFAVVDLPAPETGAPLKVYLSAGDLVRAFDRPEFRPDGAIVPTNAELQVDAPSPATQRVLFDRVTKHPDVARDLQDQVEAYRKTHPMAASGQPGVMAIAVDTFQAELPRGAKQSANGLPRVVCLVATDFAKGGAINRRDLFTQDRVRKGIAACLTSLDAAGVQSVIMPLVGAASSGTQAKDTQYEGQRLLKECRLLNSVAGIALGFHDYAVTRRNIRELGIVQWEQEITDMFSVPAGSSAADSAQRAYRTYAEQIKMALNKGLAGQHMTASDIDGNCNTTFNAR
jgi:hypothetical protein